MNAGAPPAPPEAHVGDDGTGLTGRAPRRDPGRAARVRRHRRRRADRTVADRALRRRAGALDRAQARMVLRARVPSRRGSSCRDTDGFEADLSVAFLTGTGVRAVVAVPGRTVGGRGDMRHPRSEPACWRARWSDPSTRCPIVVISALVRVRAGDRWRPRSPERLRFEGVVWQAFVYPALLGVGRGRSRRRAGDPPCRCADLGLAHRRLADAARRARTGRGRHPAARGRPAAGSGGVRACRVGERCTIGVAARRPPRARVAEPVVPGGRAVDGRLHFAVGTRQGPRRSSARERCRRPTTRRSSRAWLARTTHRRRTSAPRARCRRVTGRSCWCRRSRPSARVGGRDGRGAAGPADVSVRSGAPAQASCSRCWWAPGRGWRASTSASRSNATSTPATSSRWARARRDGVAGARRGAWSVARSARGSSAIRTRGRRSPSNPTSPSRRVPLPCSGSRAA